MKLIAELIALRENSMITEAPLQSIVKKFSVPVGSFEKVFGGLAAEAAELLGAKSTDVTYELKGTDAQAAQAKKTIVAQAAGGSEREDDGEMMKVVKMIGARKVIVWGNRVLTSKEHFDSLVETMDSV